MQSFAHDSVHFIIVMFENNKLYLQNVLLELFGNMFPEGSGSWKYIHYFLIAIGKGKIYDCIGNRGDRGDETRWGGGWRGNTTLYSRYQGIKRFFV